MICRAPFQALPHWNLVVKVPPGCCWGSPSSFCHLLRGNRLGNWLIQQLQAVQDPVAEPGTAGIQTLWGQRGQSGWPGSDAELWVRQEEQAEEETSKRASSKHDLRGHKELLPLPQGTINTR